MADLTITAASVLSVSGTRENGLAGASITAGQVVYADTATGTYKLADANGASATIKTARGIALHAAANGQPLAVQTTGSVTIGATLTAGTSYYLSDTPGGICPFADVGSGENVSLIGIAASTTVLALNITNTGVTL